MQQRISRLTTTDGTELAFATVGDGRPLLYVSGWVSHLQLSWEVPEERAYFESLAQGCLLVRYDRAGCGLSAPSTRPPSLEFELEQLDAVADTLGRQPFDLMGASMGASIAAAWAAAHPERVRRLVLYGGWRSGSELSPPAVRDHVLGLVESHWGLGSDVLTDIFAPDAHPTTRELFGRYQRASSDATNARALLALSYALDVGDLLDGVRAPTLVVHRDHDRAAPLAQAEALAAGIPDSSLVVLPGRSHLPYVGDAHQLVATIRRFLGLRAARRGAGTLTARQDEVAALIAEGRTNREIADRLGIDERSAEGHVERIRLRLGFRSRAQVAAWYAAQRDRPTPAK
ncbi:LuxR family transcriptional regulator [Leifsonia sp. Leaf336]|uniref:alpha/beta fold hydrolase n=1 Tax=Leifsonia sp. Leaf336 TaxID=1736341 RepID=UPI0007019D39|nr:alpha/beta fold hydrolase [Leifsonia sp. Leaf336]KQR50736.1 LuxR family transcriptional regulator [Leifsonia sp. Leaf336]